MKKQSIQTIAKRFFLGNLLATALFLSANAATPASVSKPYSFDANKVEFKYIGVDHLNQLSFNVKYNNPSGNTFSLVVLDENGEQLYKSFYADKQFNKTFKLPKSEVSKVTFLIEDRKESVKEKFDVNVKTSSYDAVIISKG